MSLYLPTDLATQFESAAARLQGSLTSALEDLPPAAARVHRWLRGEWLGHPLHPVLVDAAGGYWMAATTLDVLAIVRASSFRRGADATLALGLLCALPTIAAGLVEWAAVRPGVQRRGLVHGSLGAATTAAYLWSLYSRLRGRRVRALMSSFAGAGFGCAAAYLGGKLVFNDAAGYHPEPASDEVAF